jgi:hypothetical protein
VEVVVEPVIQSFQNNPVQTAVLVAAALDMVVKRAVLVTRQPHPRHKATMEGLVLMVLEQQIIKEALAVVVVLVRLEQMELLAPQQAATVETEQHQVLQAQA